MSVLTAKDKSEAQFAKAVRLNQEGRPGRALEICRKLVKKHPKHVATLHLAAISADGAGRGDLAITYFERALAGGEDADILTNLAITLARLGRQNEAAPPARRAAELLPTSFEVFNNLGNILRQSGDIDGAEDAYRRAIHLRPDAPDPQVNLAMLLEEVNRVEDSMTVLGAVPPSLAGDPRFAVFTARCERRLGRLDDAELRLEELTLDHLPPVLAGIAAHELGQIHDKRQNWQTAYGWFEAANGYSRKALPPHIRPETYPRLANDLLRFLERPRDAKPTRPDPEDGPLPVLLAGFPRSGTTLLELILDGHPAINAAEEKPILHGIRSWLAENKGGYPSALATLDEKTLGKLRTRYWQTAEAFQPAARDGLFVDRNPLGTLDAILFNRLFPDAKIIFAVRHPADVCLSCFMQNFADNPAMANFQTLQETVDLYVLTMTLWRNLQEKLAIDHIRVRYEDVVTDLETQIRRVIDFLDLDWHDGLLDHQATAKKRGRINTASYAEVAQPIYDTSRYRWKNYKVPLAPAMDRLQPFIQAFGYDET